MLLKNDDFNKLIEYAIEGHCKICKRVHKNCNVYRLYKKYNVPRPIGYKAKCKYGYWR
ncbi:DUF5651 domain-containing protein [Clostridium pasteurianum]|uniref:DUF5651 domain-containing protein n=1 Tax=Clostridium pasteurianum TaxID=1501 RepID=UPI003D6D7E18